jgi:GT2 family glycosyltransferase
MATEPLVFIILVNWNGREITLECLASLDLVSYKNFKVVVVDNGSSDGSAEAIALGFPNVVVLEMHENLRFAEGNNAGMRYALEHGAELVLLLNNDTVVDTDFLPHLVERIRSDSATGMVAPKIFRRRTFDVDGYIETYRNTRIGRRSIQ